MKEYGPNEVRNVGLVSHQAVGKTSLAEAMLYSAGATSRLGSIDDGSTTGDYRTDEIERKISISTSLMNCEWKEKKLNIIDMPGYFDFIGEVKCGLKVSDLAVLLLNGVNGVEVGTELYWDVLEEYGTPRLFYINHMDKEHANFDKVAADAKDAYGNNVLPVQFPVNQGEGFNSVIDILRMKKVVFNTDESGKYKLEDIPAEFAERAEELRNEFIEKVAESDDEILEKYFEQGKLSDADLVKGLKAGIISKTIFPLLIGAASKNIGTQLLMDFIASYGPSPVDRAPYQATAEDTTVEINADENDEFAAVVFKTLSEMHVGELSLIRVYSGSITSGVDVLNTSRDKTEKIGQIYTLNGKTRTEIGVLKAGDIGALVKLKDTHTGNTLCSKKRAVTCSAITFPEAVVEIAVSPKSKGDEEKIGSGLHTLHEIDPSFKVKIDPELRQTVISGQGELHLQIIVQRLKERYGVEVEQKKPKIPYRETITSKADEKYRHKKQTGGAGQFAEVWMRIEPKPRGEGFEFESKVVGGNISSVFIPSVEKGVKQIMVEGAVAGYKIVDVKATVYDGKEHPVDSKDIAFQIAGREVFRACIKKAKPILLEPIYNVTVKSPEEYMGDVMGDISTRRGKIQGMDSAGRFQVVKALVPLNELHNYSTSLRSMTQGRATFARELSHYDPVPRDVEMKIIAESQEENN